MVVRPRLSARFPAKRDGGKCNVAVTASLQTTCALPAAGERKWPGEIRMPGYRAEAVSVGGFHAFGRRANVCSDVHTPAPGAWWWANANPRRKFYRDSPESFRGCYPDLLHPWVSPIHGKTFALRFGAQNSSVFTESFRFTRKEGATPTLSGLPRALQVGRDGDKRAWNMARGKLQVARSRRAASAAQARPRARLQWY